jgi:DNA-binding NarL/FixJ family response regulator
MVRSLAMSELRLVVAEDNLLVREGLLSLVAAAPDLRIEAVCSSLDELRAAVDAVEPDVVVTDIRMPPTHRDEGVVAALELRVSRPQVGVVVLSQFVDPAFALALFEHGTRGRGYLLKDRVDEAGRLADAIRTVAVGGSFIDDDVVDALVRARTRMVDSPLATLTPRELDVLAEMATGAANSAIAHSLGLSIHSVEKHSTSIFTKLGLDDAADVNRRVMAVLQFLSKRTVAEGR